MKKQFILIQQLENHEINEQFHIWQPPIDIFESRDKFIVKAEIAGMEGKGFDINFFHGVLSICGYRPRTMHEGSCHRMEIPFGKFIINTNIPGQIDKSNIEAFYENGFLTINLPKKRPVAIEITEE